MFVENKSLHYIEADAQDVAALYRSTVAVVLEQEGRERQPCEAFVCVVQDGMRSDVYLALMMQNSRNFAIFVPHPPQNDKAGHEDLVSEALATAREWGFEMKSVNLSYSKALKEVVLSDLRVVRQPPSTRKSAQKKGGGERHGKSASHEQLNDIKTEVRSVAHPHVEPGENLKAIEATVVSKEQVKKGSVTIDKANSAITKSKSGSGPSVFPDVRYAVDEKRSGSLAEHTLKLNNDLGDSRTEKSRELASLKADIERISKEKSAAQAKLNNDLDETRKELALLNESKDLEQQTSLAEISGLRAELEKLARSKLAAEEAASLKVAELRSEIETVLHETAERNREAMEEVARLKEELKLRSKARSEVETMQAKEVADLRSELKSLSSGVTDGELEELRAELEKLKSEKESVLSATEAEKSAISREIERTRNEILECRDKSDENLSILKAELEELIAARERDECEKSQQLAAAREELAHIRAERTSYSEATQMELASLRSEIQRLTEDRTLEEEKAARELSELRDKISVMVEEKSAAEEALAGSVADLKCEAERLVSEKEAAAVAATAEQSGLSELIQSIRAEITDSTELAARKQSELLKKIELLKSEKAEAEEKKATELGRIEKELLELKNEAKSTRDAAELEIGRLMAERDQLKAETDAESVRSAAEMSGLREETERLLREKEAMSLEASEEREAAGKLAAELVEEIRHVRSVNSAALSEVNAEIERLTLERESVEKDTAEQLGSATEKAAQLAAELLAAEISAIEKSRAARSAARALISALSGDGGIPNEMLNSPEVSERLAALLRDADRLAEEKSGLEDTAVAELASLRARVAILENENKAARKAAAAEAEALESEARRLLLERKEAERADGERLANLTAEVERLAKEADTARKAVAAKIARLNEESEQLNDARKTFERAAENDPTVLGHADEKRGTGKYSQAPANVATSPALQDRGETAASAGSGANKLPMELSPQAFGPLEIADGSDPFAFLGQGDGMLGNTRSLGHEQSGPSVRFSVDRALKDIVFASPDDVLEVHKSLNRTRVAMEDNTTVNCDSFLCAVRRDGKPHVFIALYQVDSKLVLVYTPERQPEDSEEFEKIMRDGMDFIEIVGFMMDGVDLDPEKGGRTKVLGRIPVLRQEMR